MSSFTETNLGLKKSPTFAWENTESVISLQGPHQVV